MRLVFSTAKTTATLFKAVAFSLVAQAVHILYDVAFGVFFALVWLSVCHGVGTEARKLFLVVAANRPDADRDVLYF